MIGYGLWQRRFGSDPRVIGQKITLNDHDFAIIGVAPADFASPFAGNAIDVWTPVMMKDYVARPHFSLTDRGSRWLMVMGRLKPGATVSQAQANIAAIASHLEQEYPQTNEQIRVAVYSVLQSPFSLKQEHAACACDFNGCRCGCAADRLRECREPALGAPRTAKGDRAAVWL